MLMGLTDAAIMAALGLQAIATVFFCVFGIYCYLMVWLHVRNKASMLAQDAAVWAAWSRPDDALPFVTVQLPLYNEQYVVTRLIETIVRLDYPKDRFEIQILDDSSDATTQLARDLAERYRGEGFDIALHRRADRTGYKAGALKEGNKTARGEFIAIFDADFVPDPDFLRKTIPFFDDPKIGAVQTLWGHLNADYSQITLAQSVVLDGINYVIQTAQCWSGVMMHFQGTAGVWRRTAIDDAGGWQADTLTEDLDLSYRAQIRGWKLKYLPQVLCPGELPPTISAARTQQHRWVKGGFQTASKLLPDILKSSLTPYAKAEATYHMMALALAPSVLIMAMSWPAQLWLRQHAGMGETLLPIAVLLTICSFGPTVMFLYAQKDLYPNWTRRLHYYLYVMVWGLGIAVTNARAILEVFFGIKSGFVRTPKFRIEGQSGSFIGKAYGAKVSGQVIVEALIALYCLCGVVVMIWRPQPIIDPFLIIFTIGIWLVVVKTLWEPIAQHRAARKAQPAPGDGVGQEMG